jgi:3'-5' exonuclease
MTNSYFKKTTEIEMSNTVIFDIETIPLPEDQYTATQLDYIDKKLSQRVKKELDLDIESERKKLLSLDPLLAKIACIGLYYPSTKITQLIMDQDESIMLKQFWNILAGFSGVFVSFNGQKFDCPFIIRRSMYHQIEPTNRDFLKYTAYNPMPEHFDVMLHISGREGYISLEHACQFLNVVSPKDGEVSAENVAETYYKGEWDKIKQYCEKDLIATAELYLKVKNYSLPK